MSWRKITMKFAGKCVVCNENIAVGDPVLWAKGEGVKHESCDVPKEIPCMVCGGRAGCSACELREECDLERISPMCICPKCADDDGLANYISAVNAKYPVLDSSTKLGQSTLV